MTSALAPRLNDPVQVKVCKHKAVGQCKKCGILLCTGCRTLANELLDSINLCPNSHKIAAAAEK